MTAQVVDLVLVTGVFVPGEGMKLPACGYDGE